MTDTDALNRDFAKYDQVAKTHTYRLAEHDSDEFDEDYAIATLDFEPFLVALIMLMTSVSDANAKRKEEIDKSEKALKDSKPQSKGLLGKLDEQVGKLNVRRGELWDVGWERQKKIFVLPDTIRPTVEAKKLKFGDAIPPMSSDPAAICCPLPWAEPVTMKSTFTPLLTKNPSLSLRKLIQSLDVFDVRP